MGTLLRTNANERAFDPTILALSPLFLVSVAVHTSKKGLVIGESSDGDIRAQKQPQPVDHDLSLHLSSYLSSYLGRVQYGKYLPASSTPAYSSINRLHELTDLTLRVGHDSPGSMFDDYDFVIGGMLLCPRAVLAFLLGRLLEASLTLEKEAAQWRPKDSPYDELQETYRSSRIALLSTPVDGMDESCPSNVRLARWKCLASTCLRSTVSELSQIKDCSETAEGRASRSKRGRDNILDLERDMIQETPSLYKSSTSLMWLLLSAFADSSSDFRYASAPEIGRILLASKAGLLYTLFSTPSQWRRQDKERELDMCTGESLRCATAEVVVGAMFQEIDRLLYGYCHVPQSQLSFTMGHSAMNEFYTSAISSTATRKASSAEALSFQRSAIMALSSMCIHADTESLSGLLVFEQAMSRLIRFWTALDADQDQSTTVMPWIQY